MSLTVRLPLLLAGFLALATCAPLLPEARPPAAPAPAAVSYPQSAVRTPPPGPHAVGFRAVELTDPSRGFGAPFDEQGNEQPVLAERPVAVSVWYPAAHAGGGEPLRMRDYLGFFTTPGRYPGPPEQRGRTAIGRILSVPAHGVRELDAAVHAAMDAPAAPGQFPLVVYAPGLGASAVDNFYLHEWLASRGYVVVGVDSWGPYGRPTGDAPGLETQVRDMEFALGWARALPNVDGSRVAFMGFSWGGMANVMAAVRNPAVGAVVSLDGSIHFFAERMKDFPFFSPDRLTVPALFLSSRQLTPEARAANRYDFFDRLHYSDATMVVFPRLGHMNFTSFSPLIQGANPNYETDPQIVGASLEWIARYTAAFLDAVLRDDEDGRAFLARSAAEHGLPADEALIERRTAHRPLPTPDAFAAEARRQGRTLADAPAVLESIRRSNPAYTLPEAEVDARGNDLLRRGRADEALQLFRLNTLLHAEAPSAWASLGAGYAAAGRYDEARSHFARAVALAETSGHPRLAEFRDSLERAEQMLRERREQDTP